MRAVLIISFCLISAVSAKGQSKQFSSWIASLNQYISGKGTAFTTIHVLQLAGYLRF